MSDVSQPVVSIAVDTYHLVPTDNGEMDWAIEKTKLIDHNNYHDRRWLAKHCWWAMRNNRMVTTYPVDKADEQ